MATENHILAGFLLGFRHRDALSRVMTETSRDSTILSLDPVVLKVKGITVLALDFDGVLAPHGFPEPLPEVEQWLKSAAAVLGEDHIFILSNKPNEIRRSWFNVHFPEAAFISGLRKKPFPDGLNKIGELARVPLSQILMVDDRLLTGCLAAVNAGASVFYVRRPYVSLTIFPFSDLFFQIIRLSERALVKFVTRMSLLTTKSQRTQ